MKICVNLDLDLKNKNDQLLYEYLHAFEAFAEHFNSLAINVGDEKMKNLVYEETDAIIKIYNFYNHASVMNEAGGGLYDR
jgi:hypothetical protein